MLMMMILMLASKEVSLYRLNKYIGYCLYSSVILLRWLMMLIVLFIIGFKPLFIGISVGIVHDIKAFVPAWFVVLNRVYWMENMMTSQSTRFTWLEELKRWLKRPRRLPRNLLPRQISFGHFPLIFFPIFWQLRKISNIYSCLWCEHQDTFILLRLSASGYFFFC